MLQFSGIDQMTQQYYDLLTAQAAGYWLCDSVEIPLSLNLLAQKAQQELLMNYGAIQNYALSQLWTQACEHESYFGCHTQTPSDGKSRLNFKEKFPSLYKPFIFLIS